MTCLPFKTSDNLPADLTKALKPAWKAITFTKRGRSNNGLR
jgi:hypothetical protein